MSESPADLWLAFHLYYHEAPSRAVARFVEPVVSSLLCSGWIDRFFFVHFRLGGPHIRLRLQLPPDCRSDLASAVHTLVEQAAMQLFAEAPSTRSLEEPHIAAINRSLLASDPFETDAAVYPDNYLRAVPFRPEVERYGGPDLLEASLDFFSLSSLTALRFLRLYGEEPRSRQLVLAWRLLLGQSLAFARDGEELLALLKNPVDSWGELYPAIAAKSERVFDEQHEVFLALFHKELEGLGSSGGLSSLLTEGARRLSWALRESDGQTHWRVGSSQLHMTANRLGLMNVEEAYLGGLLVKTAREVKESREELWRALETTLEQRREQPPAGRPLVRDLLFEASKEATQ